MTPPTAASSSEIKNIASNVHNIVNVLGGMCESTSADPLTIILDKSNMVLEELRTIQILSESHSEGLQEQLSMIEKNIQELESFFDKIVHLEKFVQQTKSDLDKLEKLCNVVDRQ